MKLYNFKAFSKKTELDQKNLIDAENLEEFINDLQANKTMYHCTFDVEHRPSLVQYDGHVRPVFDTIHIDLDSKGDEGAQAWVETKALCVKLADLGVPFHVYFSGNKGFHIAIHKSAFNITEGHISEIIPRVKNLYYSLVETYPTVDTGIWNSTRKFRAFRSQHEETGLYKIRLTGIGIKASDLSIGEIRNLALKQQALKYEHPASTTANDWLVNLTNQAGSNQSSSHSHKKSRVKEVDDGKMIEDDAIRFKNFADKKCVKQMLEGTVLPQFNRHQIELALAVEMRQQGKTLDEAIVVMNKWASKVYKSEPERVTDCERQVRDMYSKDMGSDKLYQFGCYGEIKSAYCSAKCKIYPNLDPKKRPEPIDCTKTQKSENEVRRNPALEMSEGMIADRILLETGNIVTSNGEYFRWETNHWKRIDRDRFTYLIKQCCIQAYANKAKNSMIESLFKHTLSKIPVAPEANHFFATSPDQFNFLDGTVTVKKDDKGKVSVTMKPHDPNDYLGYCAPFPLYGDHNLGRSGDFAHFVETRRKSLGDDGMRALKQLFGAALIPFEPRIFFLLGESNTGKSTSAVIIERLLGAENVSSCDPTSDYQFEWEPSIGKIANIRRELPPRKPLQDDKLKEFRDKRPIGIQRKGIKGVMATVPFLHIYCCNKLPPTLEGNTGALDNRITILKFKLDDVNGFGMISNLGDWLWNRDAGGILDFAREGLQLLIENNFQYERTQESGDTLREWQEETDPVKLYYQEIKEGVRKIEGSKLENGGIVGVTVYSDFVTWTKENGFYAMSSSRFYKELERCGVQKVKKMKVGKVVFWNEAEVEAPIC